MSVKTLKILKILAKKKLIFNLSNYINLFNELDIYGLEDYFQNIRYISEHIPFNISNILNIKERVLIHYISENKVIHLNSLKNDLYIIYDVQEIQVTDFFKHCINNNISTHRENTYYIKELVIHNDYRESFNTELIEYNNTVERELKVYIEERSRITDFKRIEFL